MIQERTPWRQLAHNLWTLPAWLRFGYTPVAVAALALYGWWVSRTDLYWMMKGFLFVGGFTFWLVFFCAVGGFAFIQQFAGYRAKMGRYGGDKK